MLAMHPDCQTCGADLPAEAPGSFICSVECTYCAPCAERFDDICPGCGGELIDRPTRAKALHDKFPPATARRFQP